MLKRMLAEFAEIAIPSASQDPVALDVHAGRMHKLRGSAGMLGATTIQQIAGEAEVACMAGEIERAAHLATLLVTRLQRLSLNVEPALAMARAADPSELPGGGAFQPQELTSLIRQLRRQSLSAMEHFDTMSPQLRRTLGRDSYARVRDHVENLQFDDAAKILEASQASAG